MNASLNLRDPSCLELDKETVIGRTHTCVGMTGYEVSSFYAILDGAGSKLETPPCIRDSFLRSQELY